MADSRNKPEIETLSYTARANCQCPACKGQIKTGVAIPECKTCKGFKDKYCFQTGKMIPCPDCNPEQPSQNIMIIEEIEALMSQVNHKIHSLSYNNIHQDRTVKYHALEEVDLFKKTTLFELRKAFE